MIPEGSIQTFFIQTPYFSPMYCIHCGSEVSDDAKVCQSCGQPLQSRKDLMSERKDPSRSALYSLVIMGGGQMYIGNMRRGVYFLAAAVVLTIALVVTVLAATEDNFWELAAMIAMAAILFALWIVNIFDAYNQARLHNAFLRDTGRPPKYH